VPLKGFLPDLVSYVDRAASSRTRIAFGPFAFDDQSVDQSEQLLHLSHPFFAAVLTMMERDDRGKAWGFWRLSPNTRSRPEVYVRFDFVISADLEGVREQVATYGTLPSLRRRADAALAVEHRVVWVDRHGSIVTDAALLSELDRPYRPSERGGRDLNLRPERWQLVGARIEVDDWEALVLELRRRAEAAVRADQALIARCDAAAAAIKGDAEHTTAILRARALLLDESRRAAAVREIALEQQVASSLSQGVRRPRFRVDSAGAIFLGSSPLQ